MSRRSYIQARTKVRRQRHVDSTFSHIDTSQAYQADHQPFGPAPRSTLVVAGSRLSGRYSDNKISIDMAPSLSWKVASFCLPIRVDA
jgi:hypothetical protein